MKKIISLLLISVMVLGLAACGTVNDTDVAILWDDAGSVKVPQSLINAFERAMYSKKIAYTHYGANGDSAEQIKQAEEALDAGCAVLLVKLVDPATAQTVADLAKAKETPVIFFESNVDASVIESYEKCASVDTDDATVAEAMGEMIGGYIVENAESLGLDRNGDGKISYLSFNEEATSAYVDAVNKVLKDAGAAEITSWDGALTSDEIGAAVKECLESENEPELFLTENDTEALELLVALQENGYNKDKLKTHLIPVFTVGTDVDYKTYVLEDKPEGTREDEAVMEYYESVKYIVDLTAVEDDELDEMIYNTSNVIDTSRLTGTAIEDYDAVAAAVAAMTANLITGAELLDGVSEELSTEGRTVKVPYTVYCN